MGDLIGVEIVSEFIQSVLMTGKVKGFPPVSALLIATPECGKTSIVTDAFQSGRTKSAIQLTDVTGRGLMELCKNHPEVTHFIFNDMVTILSHKQSVNTYTLSVLNAMTEEGIQSAAYPGRVESYEHGKRAIIGCVTTTMMKDQRRWWNAHGLSSRLFPFCYDHDATLTIKVKDSIEMGHNEKKKKKAAARHGGIVVKKLAVEMSPDIRKKVRVLSDSISHSLGDSKGYRRLHQFNSLIRGHALARADRNRKVTQKDLEFLYRIQPYISYEKPQPLRYE